MIGLHVSEQHQIATIEHARVFHLWYILAMATNCYWLLLAAGTRTLAGTKKLKCLSRSVYFLLFLGGAALGTQQVIADYFCELGSMVGCLVKCLRIFESFLKLLNPWHARFHGMIFNNSD